MNDLELRIQNLESKTPDAVRHTALEQAMSICKWDNYSSVFKELLKKLYKTESGWQVRYSSNVWRTLNEAIKFEQYLEKSDALGKEIDKYYWKDKQHVYNSIYTDMILNNGKWEVNGVPLFNAVLNLLCEPLQQELQKYKWKNRDYIEALLKDRVILIDGVQCLVLPVNHKLNRCTFDIRFPLKYAIQWLNDDTLLRGE